MDTAFLPTYFSVPPRVVFSTVSTCPFFCSRQGEKSLEYSACLLDTALLDHVPAYCSYAIKLTRLSA